MTLNLATPLSAGEPVTSGFMGWILVVDVGTGAVEKLAMTEELARGYLGGHGVNIRLLYDYVPGGADPLGEENALIICTGTLVGTGMPAASRSAVMAKSPQSGLFGTSNTGHLAAMVKRAGWDNIVIKGKADKPVYLKITNDQIEVCDASHLWGRDTLETTDALKSELGEAYWVAAIGHAGEHQVLYASILCEKIGALGRTGMGAVMGSKNLKAIAIYGDRDIHTPEGGQPRFMRALKKATTKMLADKAAIDGWRKGGTLGEIFRSIGEINSGRITRSDDLEARSYEAFENAFEKRRETCYGCPVGCLSSLVIKKGPRKGNHLAVSCTASTMANPFGITLGIKHFEDVAHVTEWAQRWAIDTLNLAQTIYLGMELYEAGVIDDGDLGGLRLEWGNPEAILEVMDAIVHQRGFGAVLALGPGKMLTEIGRGAEAYAIDYKNGVATQELIPDLRGMKHTNAFGRMINPRGAHFDMYRFPRLGRVPGLEDASAREQMRAMGPHIGVPEDGMAEYMDGDPYNIPVAAKYEEGYAITFNSLGVCDRVDSLLAYPFDDMVEAYAATTGIEMDKEEIIESAERVWTLEKCFNVREGWTRKDDQGPERIYTEPLVTRTATHPPLERAEVDGMLDTYYASHQWDVPTGIPTKQRLRQLDLEHAIADLEQQGVTVPD